MPLIVVERSYFPFLNQKQFVLIQMIVRRRAAARRSDLRPEGKFSSGLRTGQMEDNLFAKRMQCVTLAGSKEMGRALRSFSTKLLPMFKFDKLCCSVCRA